ncbi:MAG: GNAT family N-acetyltransferase [Elusimicrobiota bacterium]
MTEIAMDAPGVTARSLREDHIDGILELMNKEGWYYYDRRELERYVSSDQVCYVLLKDGRVIGSIFTTGFGGQAWIGNIVVSREARGTGLARKMIDIVISDLRKRGIGTFRLGSVPLAIRLYKKVGFRPEGFTSAQEANLPVEDKSPGPELGDGAAVEPLQESDLRAVCDLDWSFFKSDRKRLLRRLFEDSVEGARVCLKAGGKVAGFLMIRRRAVSKKEGGFAEGPDHAYRLGPACVLPEHGIAGFKALFRKAIPAINEEAARLGGSAKIYVVFPRNAAKDGIYKDTRDLAAVMGMDAGLDLDAVFDEHEHIFAAAPSKKNAAQWDYMESLGFHQEYFEQVMSYAPDKGKAEATRADPEGIFATATPGDKA